MTAAKAVGASRKVSMKRPSGNVELSKLSGTEFEVPLVSWSFQFSPNRKREPVEGRTGVFCEEADGISADKTLGDVT
jgi:hypothetical protein